ncbi:MAG: hypothetical protein MJ168_04395 [Clostridia bacterium]|nr:hypothetical protein [Clostridia bacterium]
MKKAVSAILVVIAMVFVFTSCGNSKNVQYDQVVGFYSIHSTKSDFMVHFDSKVGAYEKLYDENDVHIKLKSGAKILDAQGNEIKVSDINIGDALIISYNGSLSKEKPKTIEAYKIQKQF